MSELDTFRARVEELGSEIREWQAERNDLRSQLDVAVQDLSTLRTQLAEATAREAVLRQAIEWLCEEGGWRLHYYANTPIPEVFAWPVPSGVPLKLRAESTDAAALLAVNTELSTLRTALEAARTALDEWNCTTCYGKGRVHVTGANMSWDDTCPACKGSGRDYRANAALAAIAKALPDG